MRVLALDMGGTFIKYAVCNIDKKMNIKFIEKGRYRTYDGGNVFKEMQVIDNMGKFAKKCIKKYPDIQCVCSSIGGILDVDNYRVLVSATHKYGDPKMHNIKSRFGKYVKLPLYIINDIKAGGLGELRYGALKKHGKTADAVFIGIGTGIAAVTIINGKLHLGKTWAAGEIGPMVINNHYYENHYALPWLINRCKEIDKDIVTAEDCLRLSRKYKQIKNIVDAWFVGLVEGVVSMIYMMNPEYVIFGGKITEDKYFNLKTFKDLMLSNCRQPILNSITGVKLIKAKLGNDAALYGAASLAINRDYKL